MADSCGGAITVTVTQTILQGAATSTTDAPASPIVAAAVPLTTPTDQGSPFPSATSTNTDGISSSAIAFGYLPASLADTTLTTTAPGTTLTLNLAHATPSTLSGTITSGSTTHKLSSTSSCTPKPTASKAASGAAAPKASTPPATIAGGVLGSFAGLALIIALLLWCCRRKRKITFKRTVKKVDPDQEQQAQAQLELESARQERDQAVQSLQSHNKPLPSPRSLDFGLPKISHSTSPVMAQRWL